MLASFVDYVGLSYWFVNSLCASYCWSSCGRHFLFVTLLRPIPPEHSLPKTHLSFRWPHVDLVVELCLCYLCVTFMMLCYVIIIFSFLWCYLIIMLVYLLWLFFKVCHVVVSGCRLVLYLAMIWLVLSCLLFLWCGLDSYWISALTFRALFCHTFQFHVCSFLSE